MAEAPAKRNSMASRAFMIPPKPTTGIFTAWATCHTIRKATGFTAGPLSPPVAMDNTGRRFSMSIAIPINVLIRLTESAPASSTLRAMSATFVTFGDSLTIKVLSYALRTAFTTAEAPSAVTPKAIPPCFTFGQDMFSSMAGMRSSSLMRAAHSA